MQKVLSPYLPKLISFNASFSSVSDLFWEAAFLQPEHYDKKRRKNKKRKTFLQVYLLHNTCKMTFVFFYLNMKIILPMSLTYFPVLPNLTPLSVKLCLVKHIF